MKRRTRALGTSHSPWRNDRPQLAGASHATTGTAPARRRMSQSQPIAHDQRDRSPEQTLVDLARVDAQPVAHDLARATSHCGSA
jgi:hypothetical protein